MTPTAGSRRATISVRIAALIAALTLAVLVVAGWQSSTGSSTASSDLAFPIRAAFYYPWYPEHWETSHFEPGFGNYKSANGLVVTNQIAQMQYAHIDAGIVSWWGPNSIEDERIPALLASAETTGFRWTLYYEMEAYANYSSSKIGSDLDYIYKKYTSDPAYLSVDGKPVLFVFANLNETCSRFQMWDNLNAGRFYISFRAPNHRVPAGCADAGDAWHVYDPWQYWQRLPGNATSISPGFWKGTSEQPVLKRDTNIWTWVSAGAYMTGDPWQLVTTWNEWPEGTGIEPDTTHGFDYINVLNTYWAPDSPAR